MTAPSPLLAASTERLAAAMCEPAHLTRWPLWNETRFCGECWSRVERAVASGVVVPAASLADDAALVDAAMQGAWSGDPHKNDRTLVRQALRALAAALEVSGAARSAPPIPPAGKSYAAR